MLKGFKTNKGFTLIELAIVLVIIGIIVGAVLKGQDLIQNARYKKFINDAGRKFEVVAWTYFDRMGRFPGASSNNVLISGNPKSDIDNAKFINPPENPVTIGSYNFYVFYGNDGTRNVIVVCKDNNCNNNLEDDEIGFMTAFDTAIDGVADGTSGMVRGYNGSLNINSNNWVVSGITSTNFIDWTSSGNKKALVYYFDRRPQ